MKVASAESLGQAAWDGLLSGRPGGSLLQSWTWGELQSRFGWAVERLLFDEGASGVSSIQRARSLFPGGARYYVPRGPAVEPAVRDQVVGELVERARKGSGMVLQVEPDSAPDGGWQRSLEHQGFKPGMSIQPLVTQLLRIDGDPEQLRAAFKPKTRYNLSLAERKGVTVSRSTDVQTFARLSAETARRQGIALPGLAYYQAALDLFLPLEAVRLYLAHHEGTPLAGIIVFRFGETAYYLFGASGLEKRELMPNYLLHWTAMLEFRSLGCTTYDWWGIPEEPKPDHPWFGLYRFKTGFGGDTVRYPGLHERVLRDAAWRWEERLRKLKGRVRSPILG